MLEEQVGNCGVAISGWNSNRLKHSHCAESKTANYEEVTLATASSHLPSLRPSRALGWMYGFLCKVSSCGASLPHWGRGWGSNSPSTHSVATSREAKVRVLVIASVSELKISWGFVYFSTSGLNPFSPFFPHCQHHSVRYLHLPGLSPSSLSHLLTSGFVSLICAPVTIWLPSLDTLDVIF